MRILVVLLCLISFPVFGEPIKASFNPGPNEIRLIEAVDGDTFKVEIVSILPKHMNIMSVRVFGIDTPEKGGRAKCSREDELAQKASKITKDLITDKRNSITIDPVQFDKFGGRFDARVYINGMDLAEILIDKGLARSYHGEKKGSWCK